MTNEEMLSQALDILYKLEDRTGYSNKNISEAINLLQNEIKPKQNEQNINTHPINNI